MSEVVKKIEQPLTRDPKPGEFVRLWNGELGLCLGRWINNGTWDGSYRVKHEDGAIGYWFPTRIRALGVTIT
jgi:hypothetical protein